MSTRRGPPKHQNSFAWKPNAGIKINEKEVGGKFRPYSEITGVCPRCKEQIDWKRRYGKYKPLAEPAKCQSCSKRAVRQAYHNLCTACAKEQKVCAKCRCKVECIVGRDSSEIEAEQKELEEAIKHARERDRRTLLRAMTKGGKSGSNSSEKSVVQTQNDNKVGDLFPSATLEGYARSRTGAVHGLDDDDDNGDGDGDDDDGDDDDDEEEMEEEDQDEDENENKEH